MEIQDIKTQISIGLILDHYGMEADKNQRMRCPFHDDKTPSMQIYTKTNTAYCFSSNCRTHGKSLDVIDFIMYKESITKHEAIEKAKTMINGQLIMVDEQVKPSEEFIRTDVLTKIFIYFKNGLNSSVPALEYLKSRNLDPNQIEVGYNAGQFHYTNRDNKELIKSLVKVGLLTEDASRGNYQIFAKNCIVFALKNSQNQVAGLYFRSTINDKESKHYYLKDRSGLYPHYPHQNTKGLIITEAIIDAATLLQNAAITQQYSIVAAYGTNGLTEEHQEAIRNLKELEEVIFFFDGDESGKVAVNKYAIVIKEMLANIKISIVNTPDGEDVNSLLVSHSKLEVLQHLIEQRKPINCEGKVQELLFSTEEISIEKKSDDLRLTTDDYAKSENLNTENPNNISYESVGMRYEIKGSIKPLLDSLKISLQIINIKEGIDYRSKLDLYEYKQIQTTAEAAAEVLHVTKEKIQRDLMILTKLLEHYRNTTTPKNGTERIKTQVNEINTKACIEFLKQTNCLTNINKLIGQCGVIGEENTRILLFVIATSYKMKETLHALIQGSSGSGKTRLLKIIGNLIPQEDVKRFTRVTESSFYNYGEYDLVNRFLCFEDIDGLKEEALLALRELMSNDILISSTSQKFDDGNIRSTERTVRGPIASIACTTRGDYYEDNISRSFVIAVDESREQTQRIINYQNQKYAGQINEREEEKTNLFLQNCIRLLKPYKIINPYANKIHLPDDAHKIRRLNEMYQSIVKQITIINQYQRKQDNQGRLITEKEDLQIACEILFESIILKVDELDGSLRQFFEKLKSFVKEKNKGSVNGEISYEFNRFEIMNATGIKKTQQHFYINKLVQLEYLKQRGFANRGFTYQIAYWDNMQGIRTRIKDSLNTQLQNL
ncbi:MAG: toprim domain-containing protein [Saprospiraceae bacterium]|nr:toprim domain-containing protein [Candidatus Vicinibacter affinis]